MKTRLWMFVFVFSAVGLFLSAGFTRSEMQESPVFPDDVDQILKNSCLGCHNSESRNDDAKDAMQLDMWSDYGLPKKIGILGDIDDVLENDEMPPGGFRKRFPDRVPSAEQVKILREWAQNETKALLK